MPEIRHSIGALPSLQAPSRPLPTRVPQWADGRLWVGLILGICWYFFFGELSDEWRLNAQYSYGYVVPLLGLALLWRRWPERPDPVPRPSSSIALVFAVLLFELPVLRLVLEANPEWRLLYWLQGVQVIGLSGCFLWWIGGVPWVRYLLPPLTFMLIAVPWPMGLEEWAIQGLMRVVAGLTVELAGWFGIPAVQHGNLIETTAGIVGIDEACSGVRSLQSALMLSLFLGEMHRFTLGRRLVLLAASLVADLAANLARTSFLVWTAAHHGLRQMEAWHDTAGLLVMLIILPALLALAYLIKPRATRSAAATTRLHSASGRESSQPSPPRAAHSELGPIPLWAGVLSLLWIAAGEVGCEVWYRLHETDLIPATRWSIAWPESNSHFRKTSLPENALAILRCSNSEAAAWEDEAGNQWSAFLLRWNRGKNSAQLAKGHRPEICFAASGAKLLEDFGELRIAVDQIDIPFRHETFDTGAGIVHVFYCLWPDRVARNERPLLEDGSQRSRLLAVLAGKRHLGQQALEVVLAGPESQEQAAKALKSGLANLIHLDHK